MFTIYDVLGELINSQLPPSPSSLPPSLPPSLTGMRCSRPSVSSLLPYLTPLP